MTAPHAMARGLGTPIPMVALSALLTLLGPLPAQADPAVADLSSCQRLSEQAPATGLAAAQAWLARGGGEAARLCRAEALFLHGEFAEAGKAFEDLAGSLTVGTTSQTANLYDRAGLAWLRAGDARRAVRLISAGLEKAPEDPDLLIDRALAHTEAKQFREAIADLSLVLKRTPRRADVFIYRAEAYQGLNQLGEALADADHALKLRPGDGEAMVLRGSLRAASGDATGARLDWREVIAHEPGSANGKAAATALVRLDQASGAASPAGAKSQ